LIKLPASYTCCFIYPAGILPVLRIKKKIVFASLYFIFVSLVEYIFYELKWIFNLMDFAAVWAEESNNISELEVVS